MTGRLIAEAKKLAHRHTDEKIAMTLWHHFDWLELAGDMTVASLADRCGIDQRRIKALRERRAFVKDMNELSAIALAMGLRVEMFFDDLPPEVRGALSGEDA